MYNVHILISNKGICVQHKDYLMQLFLYCMSLTLTPSPNP